MAPGGQGADEDAFVGGVALHADAVPQDGAAGKGAGGVYRHHPDGEVLLPEGLDEAVGEGALAHPGRAGDADDMGPAGVGLELLEGGLGPGLAFVDGPHEAGPGPDVAGENGVNVHGLYFRIFLDKA